MNETAWRIFRVLIALVLAIGLPTSMLLERSLSASLLAQIEQDLHARVTIAEAAADATSPESLDALADRLAQGHNARVTFIAPDGSVLGDSELDRTDLATVDNHGDRPEVRDALASGHGVATRYSTTIDADLLYVAVSHELPDGTGVVRVAMPTTAVDAAVWRMRFALISAGALAFALTVLGALAAARLVNRQFDDLLLEARLLAEPMDDTPDPDDDEDDEDDDDDEDDTDDPSHSTRVRLGEREELEQELTHAVRALAEQRDLVRAVVDGIQDGVVAISAKGRVELANAAAVELLGWPKVPRGKKFAKRVPVPLSEHVDEARELGGGEAELSFDRRIVEVATAHLPATDSLVLVLRDVTDLRRLERVRRDFVGNVSHELGTPIAVIRANTETLLDGGALDDPRAAKTFTEAIDRQAHRLAALVGDLLQISRIESGELPLDLEELSLTEVFGDVVETSAPDAERRGVTVEVEPTEATIFADARALHSVLENLVVNAIKYGDQTVVLAAEQGKHQTRIYVRDDGPGVPEAHRERVFERFYRVDKGRSRDVGGTGLGLSIVRNLVHAMGGRVGVDDAPEGGAAFWIEL